FGAFRAPYQIATKPGWPVEFLRRPAWRCWDVVKLGRGHARDGVISITKVTLPAELAKVISITAQKTNTALTIPITAELAEAINAAAPSEHVTFLINERGRSFSAKKFGEWFSEQCRRAGITGVSAHGLRKAACRRLAESGCPAPEIAAISGHASLAEVQRYIAAADRTRLARNAMAKVRAGR